MASSPRYYDYWGKANKEGDYHLLVCHSLDVAAVAWAYLERDVSVLHPWGKVLYLEPDAIKRLICFFLALHDLGKFADSFQGLVGPIRTTLGKTGSPPAYSVRHDSLGYILWSREFLFRRGLEMKFQGFAVSCNWLGIQGEPDLRRLTELLNLFVQACTGHHGRPPSKTNHGTETISLASHFAEADIDAAKNFSQDAYSLFQPGLPLKQDWSKIADALRPLSFWMGGFAVLCDWIGSNAKVFTYVNRAPDSLSDYFHRVALPKAEEALRYAGLLRASVSPGVKASNLFSYLNPPTPLQTLCLEMPMHDSPGLFILEDVTGAGKTEAAMILTLRLMQSQNKRGFFIGLPTMATANAMYDRMKQVYRSLYSEGSAPSLILAHGARDIHDGFQKTIFDGTLVLDRSYTADEESATAQCAAWLADNSKKGLLADGCIGTIDQSLLAILQCKFQTLRLFGMMNKVVILDEVHAYDGYMNQLLCSLLEAQASIGAPVILLSATLPLTLRKKLCRAYSKGLGADRDLLKETQQYPLLTYVSRDSTQEIAVETRPEVEREVKIQFLHSVEDVQARIAKAAQQGQCVCWIRNTVGEAMEAFTRLEQIIGEGRLHLFHARFAMGDRLEIEQKVIRLFGRNSGPEERRGQVLVATQVVEQSLDLDFDVMITDLAPIDLLIQRAGRLHRHKRDAAGSVIQAANRSGGRDQPILNLLSPNLVETPDKNWYSSFFRGASFVYPSHGQLWLTAKILHDKQKWNMPADARTLIEYVYRGDQEVPRALTDRDKKAAFKENKKESAAVQNTINLESGYTAENDNPWDDLNAPTRYNEDKSLKVVLAEVVGDTILPWRADDPHPWRASELTVGSHVLADEFILGNLPPKKDILPGGGKYSTLLPLSLGSDGRFSGLARDRQGKAIRLEYSRHLGLQKRRGGQE